MTAKLTVLYITGWCRGGTALIGNLPGQIERVVHVGELHYLCGDPRYAQRAIRGQRANAWQRSQPWRRHVRATAVTVPVLGRSRYWLTTRSPARGEPVAGPADGGQAAGPATREG